MTDAQMQDMIAAANTPTLDTDTQLPMAGAPGTLGTLNRDLWRADTAPATTGQVHYNDITRYAIPERLQGHETQRHYTGQATAGIGRDYPVPADPAISAWCSDTQHAFACRHEPVCRCGQTQRVVSYGL